MDITQKFSARRDLPAEYAPVWKFDITKRADLIRLNIGGVILLILSWVGFFALARLIRPGILGNSFEIKSANPLQLLGVLAMLVVVTIIMIVVHEAFHGLCFWIFTHEKPKFAFKWYYASATAPGWYFPRWQYILIGLAPLICITLLGVLALLWVRASLVLPVVLILIFNASGAVGDIWVVGRLLAFPPATYILDQGNSSEFFAPKQ